jgi:hypothetical protein
MLPVVTIAANPDEARSSEPAAPNTALTMELFIAFLPFP